MSKGKAVEEYFVTRDGNEIFVHRYESMSQCAMYLGVDMSTIRKRIRSGQGFRFSRGRIKYREVAEDESKAD